MSIAIVTETKSEEMRKVKVGIIGCGGIVNGKHMPSLKFIGNVEMVAFCDLIVEPAEEAKEQYGIEDASEITVFALEAGKYVMCEKTMAYTSKDAKAMVNAAKRTGKKLTIG